MSAALEKILGQVENLNQAFGDMPDAFVDVAAGIELAEEQAGKLAEVTSEVFEKMDAGTTEMVEAFAEAEDAIASMAKAMDGKADAIDGVSDSVEGLGTAAGNTGRGMQLMTQGSTRLLGSLGLMPKALGGMVTGVVQLNRGMSATIPTAAKLTAMIAPIALVATGVIGAISAIQRFSGAANDMDAVYDRATALVQQTEQLTRNLNENIDAQIILNRVGADEEIINRFDAENKAIRTQIELLERRTAEERINAANDALETYNNTLFQTNERVTAFIEESTVAGTMLVEGWRYAEATAGEMATAYLDMLESGKALSEEQLRALSEYINQMDGSLPVFMAAGDTLLANGRKASDHVADIERLTARYLELTSVASGTGSALDRFGSDVDAARASAQRMSRQIRSLQQSFGRFGQISDNVSQALSALSTATDGTTFAYGNAIDAFNVMTNIGWESIAMLFDAEGATLDLEEATNLLYVAQIELMALEMSQQLIDQALACDVASERMMGYKESIDDGTASLHELAAAAAAALDMGASFSAVQDITRNAINEARSGGRGGRGGRGGGGGGSGGGGRAPVPVIDVDAWKTRREIIRLKEDVAKIDFIGGAYQAAPVYNLGGTTVNVYPSPGMNEEAIAQRAGQYVAAEVADQLHASFVSSLA